ncbi:MAG TPA: hypothetical protein VJ455_10310 [Ignavibacteria bacterium]|nr:hypothetical protein [Ignavibacteria bacterium]
MKLKFLEPSREKGVIKCTVNKDGRLGFSSAAVERLKLKKFKYAKIAIDEELKSELALYLLLTNIEDNMAMRITVGGGYYNIRAKKIFENLKLNFKEKKYIFDIKALENDEENLYKLEIRVLDRKKGNRN